jgi:hypothetical protein
MMAGLLAATGSAAQGAATTGATTGGKACASSTQLRGPAKMGHIGGFDRPVAARAHCSVHNAGDAAVGTPPLLYNGGPVMASSPAHRIVVTPIYWAPAGHPMSAAYKSIITTYLDGVASQSGGHTNVYSTTNQYTGTNGTSAYWINTGAAIDDTSSLQSDCTIGQADTTGIYADNSGYDACVSDRKVISETEAVRTAHGLPSDYQHVYVLFLPKHVESCFYSGSSTGNSNACTINHYPTAAYCAYHGQNTRTGQIYANMPFPIYSSSVGYSCTDEGLGGGIQSPNGNVDADVEISPTSHEIEEAITDPDVSTGWYDASGYENGDECAYVYGSLKGAPGSSYNQVIAKRHYLTQEEFSNRDFATSGGRGGCLQSE